MEKEIWKTINWLEGYEGLYSISNTGNLKSNITGKYKVGVYDKDGYIRYHLYSKGKQKAISAHRLVLVTFKNIDTNKLVIDHIDGIRDNNNLSNLRWCNVIENNRWGNNSNNIMVKSKETGRVKEFLSMSEASNYYGYNRNYFSMVIRTQGYENKKFKIKLFS